MIMIMMIRMMMIMMTVDDGDDDEDDCFIVMKVILVKGVISCDVSPVAMFIIKCKIRFIFNCQRKTLPEA